MSKLTKLVKTPSLFFYDFFYKRSQPFTNNQFRQKKSTDLIISQINPFGNYQFYYYCAESLASGGHHLSSWLPVFNSYAAKQNIEFILIIRNKALFDWVVFNYPYINVAYARRAVDVESVIDIYPNIRLALYSSASISNGHLIRFNDIKHVFIGHGDSEKAGSAHKGLRWFDEIWTAGQAHIDRFHNLEGVSFKGLDFIKVGRPTLKKILINSESYVAPKYETYNINIMYLPTWEGVFEAHQYFSIPIAKEIIELLTSDLECNLDVKFHPYTGGRNGIYKEYITTISNYKDTQESFGIIASDIKIVDIIQNYNVFICDISSVVTECLSLNRPIFLYKPKGREIDLAVSNIDFDQYCYVFSSINELKALLIQVLSGDDYLQHSRQEAMDYFLGMEETKQDKMLELLSSII